MRRGRNADPQSVTGAVVPVSPVRGEGVPRLPGIGGTGRGGGPAESSGSRRRCGKRCGAGCAWRSLGLGIAGLTPRRRWIVPEYRYRPLEGCAVFAVRSSAPDM